MTQPKPTDTNTSKKDPTTGTKPAEPLPSVVPPVVEPNPPPAFAPSPPPPSKSKP